jgi:tetratricopeptide (TPR) repeat protein
VLRLVVPPSSRTDAVKSLRLLEWAHDNRRPFVIVEDPFVTVEQYLAGLARKVETDRAKLAEGLAEDGVVLRAMLKISRPVDLATLVDAVTSFATSLRPSLDGLVLVLMPTRVEAPAAFAQVVKLFATSVIGDALRIAVQDQPGLDQDYQGVASFVVDEGGLVEFLKEMGSDATSKGPPVASPPSTAAKNSKDETRIISEATGIDLRRLLLDAGTAMSQGSFKLAARRFRAARMLCHLADLPEEEAATSIAAGSALLAAGDRVSSIAAYRHSKTIALGSGNKLLAAQAELGIAGVHFLTADYAKARASYRAIEELVAEMPALCIEAMRMEGECHLAEARPAEAINSFSQVIAAAETLPHEIRRTTSYEHAGKSLAAVLDRHGQSARARAMEKRLSALATEDTTS